MRQVLVSIIIPCYNVEEYVSEAIESALNQTYRPIEIIAVDNNSADRTLKILKEYERRYPDLITVLEEKKQGSSAARNKGMSIAKGEWLQFLDADDLLLPMKIKHQMELINKVQGIKFLIGTAYIYEKIDKQNFIIRLENTGNPYIDFAFSNIGTTNSNLFQRDAVIKAGGWDESLNNAEDVDLYFKIVSLAKLDEIIYDTEANSFYRQRASGQISSYNYVSQYENIIKVRHRHYTFLQKEHPELFSQYKLLFLDMLYFPIYCLGIYDVEFANRYLLEYFEENYLPSHRPNIISRHHVMGVKIFGFPTYMRLRRIVKSILYFLRLKKVYSGYRFKNLRIKSLN